MSWIEQIDILDKQMHQDGYPDPLRKEILNLVSPILIQGDTKKRRLARRKEILDAVKNCRYRVTDAAKELGLSRQAVYDAMHDENCQVEKQTT